jgi:glycolate oxidase FAD binding subunit
VANAATIGGLLATAPDAVGDLAHGRLRDRVLGARIALPDGTLARARGRVVKNVAGYDLPRLQVGALGTLGVIVEVSLRVDPLSPSRRTLVCACDDRATAFAAARRLLAAPLAPTFVNVLDDGAGPRVAVGLDGTDVRVDGLTAAVHALLGSEASIQTDDSGLRARLDHPAGRLVLRLSARPTDLEARCESACAAFAGHMQALDARPGLGVLLLEIDEREAADVMPAIELLRADGPVVVAEAPPELRRSLDTWGPPGPDFSLMQRIKSAFDPHGVLAPGRGVGGL